MPSLGVPPQAHLASAEQLALLSFGIKLLFENGQSTQNVVSAGGRLAGVAESGRRKGRRQIEPAPGRQGSREPGGPMRNC
jgi:hypothetical protein